jgi:hypothetical protein
MRPLLVTLALVVVACHPNGVTPIDGMQAVGAQGPKGDVGPMGMQGAQGPQGPTGPQRPVGLATLTGSALKIM